MLPGPNDLFCTDLPTNPRPGFGKVLVAGATGYVGGRLVPDLLSRGYSLSVMVRNRVFDTINLGDFRTRTLKILTLAVQ